MRHLQCIGRAVPHAPPYHLHFRQMVSKPMPGQGAMAGMAFWALTLPNFLQAHPPLTQATWCPLTPQALHHCSAISFASHHHGAHRQAHWAHTAWMASPGPSMDADSNRHVAGPPHHCSKVLPPAPLLHPLVLPYLPPSAHMAADGICDWHRLRVTTHDAPPQCRPQGPPQKWRGAPTPGDAPQQCHTHGPPTQHKGLGCLGQLTTLPT